MSLPSFSIYSPASGSTPSWLEKCTSDQLHHRKAIQGNKAVIVAEAYFNVVVEVQALVLKILELIEAGESTHY